MKWRIILAAVEVLPVAVAVLRDGRLSDAERVQLVGAARDALLRVLVSKPSES